MERLKIKRHNGIAWWKLETASVPFVFGRNLYIMLSEEPEQAVGIAVIGPRGLFTLIYH